MNGDAKPTEHVLERRIRATAIQYWLIASCAFGLAVALTAAVVSLVRAATFSQAIFVSAMTLGALAVGWANAQNGRHLHPVRSSRPYLALTKDATALAWAHLVQGKVSGIRLHFLDGEMCTLYANGRDGETLLAMVRERAPHAILGYGATERQRYLERVRGARAR